MKFITYFNLHSVSKKVGHYVSLLNFCKFARIYKKFTVLKNQSERFKKTKEFCLDHGLTLNTSKTNLIIFKQPSKKIPPNFEICLDGVNLTPLKEVKLLGVVLDRHLTFASH